MNSVERFKRMSARPEFKGWPLVGDYQLGEKIPFFGQTLHYKLETGNGVEDYCSLLRHFGWAVVFGVTAEGNVLTKAQWKPGINGVEWGFAPGGIGRVKSDISADELLAKTQEFYLRETGYRGGDWQYLGYILIETGKYRGASPDDHGLRAHLYMATGLVQNAAARSPNPNELMENISVPLNEFDDVIDSGLWTEESAVACALLALRKLGTKSASIAGTGYQFGNLAEVHSNSIRTISEFNGADFSLQSLVVTGDIGILGNHYHTRKMETFLVVEGVGKILLQRVDKDGKSIGETISRELSSGSVLKVEQFTAHTFFMERGSRLVYFSSEPFNKDDMDMLPYKLGA